MTDRKNITINSLSDLVHLYVKAKEDPAFGEVWCPVHYCAMFLNIQASTLKKYIDKGEIPAMKYDRDIKVQIKEIANLCDRLQYTSKKKKGWLEGNEIKADVKKVPIKPLNWSDLQNDLDKKDGSE